MFSKYRSFSLHTGIDNTSLIPEKEPEDFNESNQTINQSDNDEKDIESEIVKADFTSHQAKVKEFIRIKSADFFMNKGHCLYKDRGTYIYMLYQNINTRTIHSVNKYLQMPDAYTIEQYVNMIWNNAYKDVNSVMPCMIHIDTNNKKQEHEELKALIGDQLTDIIIRGNNTISINEITNKYRFNFLRKLGDLCH